MGESNNSERKMMNKNQDPITIALVKRMKKLTSVYTLRLSRSWKYILENFS